MIHPPGLPFPEEAHALLAGDPVAWTRALVAVPSVNPSLAPGGAGEGPIADLLTPYLEHWGFQVERVEPVPGRPSLLASLGEGEQSLILCGHLDTVGIEGMTLAPFDPQIANDRMLGRGSADMKSGVAAILAAAAALAREEGGLRGGRLLLLLTADEEHSSLGLEALLQTLRARGERAVGAVVTEPTELALAPANKGFLWFVVEAEGVAAHGSRPEIGRDAIRQMARLLAALDRWDAGGEGGITWPGQPPRAHPLLGKASLHAGTIQGGTAPSVYPDRCRLELEFRLLPGTDPAEVEAALRGEVESLLRSHPGVPLRVVRGLERPGADLAESDPLMRALAGALSSEGLPVRVEPMTAWVESAWLMEAGIPALCFGPGSIGAAHTADESVPLREIRDAAKVLERLLREWTF
jgi:acetylornithine deacetylase